MFCSKHNWPRMAILSGLILTGCGGSENDRNTEGNANLVTSTGYFLDSAVEGIKYSTATQSGYTGDGGEYKYVDGESVTFSIGAIDLPATTAAPLITPFNIANTMDIDNIELVNIARFLQTFDSNPVEDGLQINTSTHNALIDSPQIEFRAPEFETQLDNRISSNNLVFTIPTESAAKLHIENTLEQIEIPLRFSNEAVSNKTFYLVFFGEGDIGGSEPKDVPVVAKLEFFDDNTLDYEGLLNDDNNVTLGYSIQDGLIRFEEFYDGEYHYDYSEIVCGSSLDYIKTHNTHDDTINGVELWFVSEEKAMLFAENLTSPIEECGIKPKNSLPTASIEINGDVSDWADIEPLFKDANDELTYSKFDLSALYAAQDSQNIYFQIESIGFSQPAIDDGFKFYIELQSHDGSSDYLIDLHYTLNIDSSPAQRKINYLLSDTTGGTDYGNHNWNVELDNTNLSDNNKYLELQIPKTHINLNTNYRIAFYSIKDIDEDNIHGDTAETNMNVSFH